MCIRDSYYYRNGLYFTSYDLKVLQGMTTSSNYITFKFSDRETYDTACHSLFEKGDYKYLIPTARGGTITYMQEPNSLAVFIPVSYTHLDVYKRQSLQLKNNNLCTRGSINLLPFSAIRRKR